MKRKRDIQGKFTLKNQDYRQVRSIRLTDSTWKSKLFVQLKDTCSINRSSKMLIKVSISSATS